MKKFCEHYDIWLEHADNYIDCALFLFPTSTLFRVTAIVKNLAIDYYLNDKMGREIYPLLPPDQQLIAEGIIFRIASIAPSLKSPNALTQLEVANVQVLKYLKKTSPTRWFNQFIELYLRHVETAHRNNNAGANGHIPTIDEYIDDRCHMAGMHHVISLIEYSEGAFLHWSWLEKNRLAKKLKRLQHVTAAIGGSSNDLFSFEKEVLDNGSDSNLVAVVALNHPELTFAEVLLKSTSIVREMIGEFSREMTIMRKAVLDLYLENELEASTLSTHLDGLERCVKASWIWQLHTPRYKREKSIWVETQIHAKVPLEQLV